MKILIIALFMVASTFVQAQLCKTVKIGMTREQVAKAAGLPTDKYFLGMANGRDSLINWLYGNQQVLFNGGKVEKIVYDYKKENELNKQLSEGKMNGDDFEQQLKELNDNACKE